MINMKDLIKQQTNMIRKESGMNLVTEKKEMGEKGLESVKRMTDKNQHTENRIMLSNLMGNKKLVKFYKAMAELNDVFNGYPPAASKLNQMMEKELYRQLNRTYSNYEEIYKAL